MRVGVCVSLSVCLHNKFCIFSNIGDARRQSEIPAHIFCPLRVIGLFKGKKQLVVRVSARVRHSAVSSKRIYYVFEVSTGVSKDKCGCALVCVYRLFKYSQNSRVSPKQGLYNMNRHYCYEDVNLIPQNPCFLNDIHIVLFIALDSFV